MAGKEENNRRAFVAPCVSPLVHKPSVVCCAGTQVETPPNSLLASYKWPAKIRPKNEIHFSMATLCFGGLIQYSYNAKERHLTRWTLVYYILG